jgi:hypothetical protein
MGLDAVVLALWCRRGDGEISDMKTEVTLRRLRDRLG